MWIIARYLSKGKHTKLKTVILRTKVNKKNIKFKFLINTRSKSLHVIKSIRNTNKMFFNLIWDNYL